MVTTTRQNAIAVLLAGLFLPVAVVATHRFGMLPLLALAAAAVGALLLANARLTVALAVGSVLLFESNADAGIPGPERFYLELPLVPMSASEALLLLAVAAVLLRTLREREAVRPGRLAVPVTLVAAAILGGAVTGVTAGVPVADVISDAQGLLALIVVPLLVLQVVRTRRELLQAVGLAVALVAVKAVIGIAVVVLGLGIDYEGGSLAYIEAPVNLAVVVLLTGVLAARLMGVPLPRWVSLTAILAFVVLIVSYRRSFWLGSIASLLLVVPFALGFTGRRLLVPAIAVLAVGLYVGFSSGLFSGSLAGPVGERVERLDPSEFSQSKDDRYRIDERRNVWAEIEESPLTGIGVGVPWRARYPLSVSFDASLREYVHLAALWWWLKLGLLGLAAYLVWTATMIGNGVSGWARNPDGRLRAACLGVGIGSIGVAIAELTGTFSGADPRTAVIVGALAGFVEAARRMAPEAEPPPEPSRSVTAPPPLRPLALR